MIVFKVIILGDAGSGKTCFMNNYLGNPFYDHDPPTIGVEFGSKVLTASKLLKPRLIKKYQELSEGKNQMTINELSAKMQLWGTSGQERFHSIVKSYYRNVNGVLFVCDLTRRVTFQHLKYWLEDFKNNSNIPLEEVGAAIIGNKTDLHEMQEVYESDLADLANEYNIPYYMVSSKAESDKPKIQSIFDDMANNMFEKFLENPDEYLKDLQTVSLDRRGSHLEYYKQCCNIL